MKQITLGRYENLLKEVIGRKEGQEGGGEWIEEASRKELTQRNDFKRKKCVWQMKRGTQWPIFKHGHEMILRAWNVLIW